jgi:DNA repair photolyase
VYCSPLVDPYQPAEETERIVPEILQALVRNPPAVFVIQTRGTLISRDISLLRQLGSRCRVRVSFSLTTDRDDIRRLYEPHCARFEDRLDTVRELTRSGIETFATLAPLLPCNAEEFVQAALDATACDVIGDPLHVRAVKRNGATTRAAAYSIGAVHGHHRWFDPGFQSEIVSRIEAVVRRAGRNFAVGPEAFSWLARN